MTPEVGNKRAGYHKIDLILRIWIGRLVLKAIPLIITIMLAQITTREICLIHLMLQMFNTVIWCIFGYR